VNTVSGKVVRYLSIRAKMIDGDVPFYVKIWPKLTSPFKNAKFQSIFARPRGGSKTQNGRFPFKIALFWKKD